MKLETIEMPVPGTTARKRPATAVRSKRAWVWLGTLLVLVLSAFAFDAWVLPAALAPAATEEQARAAEAAWWALTLLTAGAGVVAAAHLLPFALTTNPDVARGAAAPPDRE